MKPDPTQNSIEDAAHLKVPEKFHVLETFGMYLLSNLPT
jgi:hypothetical protein